jgi:dihydrofolate reductase
MITMRLSILVAMARNRVIGQNNTLPWHLPADLKHFKSLTMGHPIIMGRKTYESIGKPLPGRTNIIVTKQTSFHAPGTKIANSIEEALEISKDSSHTNDESFIIGGAELYQQTLKLCHRMYITEIQSDFAGDTFFPEYNHDEWQETAREMHQGDDKTDLAYHFVILDRKI